MRAMRANPPRTVSTRGLCRPVNFGPHNKVGQKFWSVLPRAGWWVMRASPQPANYIKYINILSKKKGLFIYFVFLYYLYVDIFANTCYIFLFNKYITHISSLYVNIN